MAVPDKAGNQPSEFGGVPGLYGNSKEQQVREATTAAGTPYGAEEPRPWMQKSALTRTIPSDESSVPEVGDGGTRVA